VNSELYYNYTRRLEIYVTEVKELTNGHQENNNTTSLVT
jgi:hypothetical protein